MARLRADAARLPAPEGRASGAPPGVSHAQWHSRVWTSPREQEEGVAGGVRSEEDGLGGGRGIGGGSGGTKEHPVRAGKDNKHMELKKMEDGAARGFSRKLLEATIVRESLGG